MVKTESKREPPKLRRRMFQEDCTLEHSREKKKESVIRAAEQKQLPLLQAYCVPDTVLSTSGVLPVFAQFPWKQNLLVTFVGHKLQIGVCLHSLPGSSV